MPEAQESLRRVDDARDHERQEGRQGDDVVAPPSPDEEAQGRSEDGEDEDLFQGWAPSRGRSLPAKDLKVGGPGALAPEATRSNDASSTVPEEAVLQQASEHPDPRAPAHRPLKRIVRVRDGLAVTVGIVIGAGILRTPGLIAGYLGDPWLILAVWVFGGVMAALSTVVIAEMAAALPHAGGKYVYAREAYGPVAGFVAGWSELLVTRGFSGAVKAVVIAEYIVLLTGRGAVPVIAGVVVFGYAFLHLGGLKVGTVFQNVTTLLKLLVLFVIAAVGIWAGDVAGIGRNGGGLGTVLTSEGGPLLALALAYQSVAFAYYGWEDAAKLSEETKDPGRALPRILFGGAAAVAVLYLMMNVSFLAALSPAEMAGSELVAQDATAAVFGGAAGLVVLVASLLILISSLNVNFMGLPRVAFGLARDGLAPRRFMSVSERGTPVPALVFIAAWIFVLSVAGAPEWLIRFMMLVAITVDTMVLSAVFRLRRARPGLERPFRVPGYPWVPGLTVALYVILFVVIVTTQPDLAVGAGLMLGALLVGGVVTARRR